MINDTNIKCTGCSACVNICPRDAISILLENGFYKAKINYNRCINCGLCNKVCMLENLSLRLLNKPIKVFGGKTKNKSVLLSSSSGGAFTELCKAFGNQDTFIFGVTFNKHFDAKFCYVKGTSNVGLFSGSKYVQAFLDDSFKECKTLLDDNKQVIFCGTPCQICGLKQFLSKEYENLLCIDLICHGVSSPVLFHEHISFLENKYNRKIVDFKFREKKKFLGKYIDYVPSVYFNDGKLKRVFNDYFVAGFLSGLFLNESCVSCCFKSNNRVGDISIGDLKKSWELIPGNKKTDYYSLISINTQKGLKLIDSLRETMDLVELDINNVNKFNHSFFQIENENEKRKIFLQECFEENNSNTNLEQIYRKYLKKHKTSVLPYFIPNWLKRTIKR